MHRETPLTPSSLHLSSPAKKQKSLPPQSGGISAISETSSASPQKMDRTKEGKEYKRHCMRQFGGKGQFVRHATSLRISTPQSGIHLPLLQMLSRYVMMEICWLISSFATAAAPQVCRPSIDGRRTDGRERPLARNPMGCARDSLHSAPFKV